VDIKKTTDYCNRISLTNAQKRELEFREGFLNFKGLELRIGSYSVPGERKVRKLVNAVRMAGVVTGAGIHPSIIDRLTMRMGISSPIGAM